MHMLVLMFVDTLAMHSTPWHLLLLHMVSCIKTSHYSGCLSNFFCWLTIPVLSEYCWVIVISIFYLHFDCFAYPFPFRINAAIRGLNGSQGHRITKRCGCVPPRTFDRRFIPGYKHVICHMSKNRGFCGRTYTPPNELFAGEDDDMNQWICNKKTHGTLMVTPSACHNTAIVQTCPAPVRRCQCGENWGHGEMGSIPSGGPVEGQDGQDSRGSCANKTPPIGGFSYRFLALGDGLGFGVDHVILSY